MAVDTAAIAQRVYSAVPIQGLQQEMGNPRGGRGGGGANEKTYAGNERREGRDRREKEGGRGADGQARRGRSQRVWLWHQLGGLVRRITGGLRRSQRKKEMN